MKEEGFFLLDEISLADDSVLERLNRYVLEMFNIRYLQIDVIQTCAG